MIIIEPNPHHAGACIGCGSYRYDGRHPYLHHPGCPDEGDLQMDRSLREKAAGDSHGPPLYCHDPSHDHGLPADHLLAQAQAILDTLPG